METPSVPPGPAPAGDPIGSPGRNDEPARTKAPGGGWLWAAALTAGVLAGVLAGFAGESVFDISPRPKASGPFASLSPEQGRMASRAELLDAAYAYGMLGALLGLFLGLAGGLVRGSARSAAMAATAGLIVGGIVGLGVTAGAMTAYIRLVDFVATDNLLLVLGLHGTIWGAIGAAGGLAWGLGLGRDAEGRGQVARAVLGGFLGAALGTVVFDLVGAIAIPVAMTHRPLAQTREARYFGRLVVTILAAAGAAAAVRAARRPASPDVPPSGKTTVA